MPKYVCDTQKIMSVGDGLCKISQELNESVSSYSKTVTNDLSSWEGSAKSSFQAQCNSKVSDVEAVCEYAQELGEFITKAAQAIEDLEKQLASFSI